MRKEKVLYNNKGICNTCRPHYIFQNSFLETLVDPN